ncbi:hypothetical protein AXF42_Ash005387 [Apostasia shenzhenica]|uniref:Uncharacterized protein n=1 Tax=Apostasia shenzhenica TaxID=1088818 RepID=A0A2I0B6T4_9ASPA|nr:hypothetical protein AXF42_Ash005387 [Apostasia shenzhenica]
MVVRGFQDSQVEYYVSMSLELVAVGLNQPFLPFTTKSANTKLTRFTQNFMKNPKNVHDDLRKFIKLIQKKTGRRCGQWSEGGGASGLNDTRRGGRRRRLKRARADVGGFSRGRSSAEKGKCGLGPDRPVILVSKLQRNESWTIQPYARKSDKTAMSSVAKFSIRSSDPDEAPLCTRTHTAPAVVFSGAGYTGNFFHDFSDVLLPLWRASRRFNGEVQFLVVDFRSWWIRKYLPIFSHLSRYKPIEFDGHSSVLCFPRVLVGLRTSGEMKADGDSMVGFAEFLRKAYSLPRSSPVVGKKPRLLILARSRTRKFVNMEKMLMTAKKVGFEVVVAEAEADVARFARVVNSCDVLVGVHGAGLTNLVFLPTSGVVIQVVPWGRLDFISRVYFKEPAMAMKLRYLEYDIREEESTLMDIYGRDDVAFRDPYSIHKLGWGQLKKIFLEQQDVRVNVRRFRAVLIKALKLLRENAEECLAAERAIWLVEKLNAEHIWIKGYSLEAIKHIQNEREDLSILGPKLKETRKRLKSFSSSSITHVRQEGNRVAHILVVIEPMPSYKNPAGTGSEREEARRKGWFKPATACFRLMETSNSA